MSDLISRQAAIDIIRHECGEWKGLAKEIVKQFNGLPSVQPQKVGHWIYDYLSADGHKVYHCSECGCYLKPKHLELLNSYKWCSSCGARMVEPQESEGSNGTH